MYFLRRLRPLGVVGERVRLLRVSLNTPVLSTPDLPIGPARAVIIVHREPRGRMDATIGVRSLRGGEIAYWSFDGELTSEADLDVAADAALTFAESLGFLFDEAPIGAGAEAGKQFQLWLSGGSSQVSSDEHAHGGAEPDVDSLFDTGEELELALDELATEAGPPPARAAKQERVAPPARTSAPAPPAPADPKPPAPPPRTLSKFRARPEAAADEGSGTQSARLPSPRQRLARMQLVKRRSPEDERKRLLRKLFTSF